MRRFFYLRLAVNNIQKNSQTYLPFLLTCVGTITMYFIMHAISVNHAMEIMRGSTTLKMILHFGTIVIGILATIFLLYTNSFLMKRRKKEFGLFNILGMEKRHITRIMFWETLLMALLSLTLGLISGVVLSRLMFLILLKMLRLPIAAGFTFSLSSFTTSIALFSAVFTLTLLYNLGQVQLSKPIELLRGGQMGEREPKTKWLLSLIGIGSLGTGYYMAITAQSAIHALNSFFVAVLLVMIGTYALFTAVSVAILKLLRKTKGFYYRPRHFTAVSGLLFRMKQNAAGLANICILSSAVLVTLSTTFSLYVGVEDALLTKYPRQIGITSYDADEKQVVFVKDQVLAVSEGNGLKPQNIIDYRGLTMIARQEGSSFLLDQQSIPEFSFKTCLLYFLPLEDYQKVTEESFFLRDNEVLIGGHQGFAFESLTILDKNFTVQGQAQPLPDQGEGGSLITSYFIVVNDLKVMKELRQRYGVLNDTNTPHIHHYFAFDVDDSPEKQILVYQEIGSKVLLPGGARHVESRAAAKEDFYMTFGGLFFIGIFLGALFLIGTILIIYYKQITEGFDDQARFAIMQKVGMSRADVKKAIGTQVQMVFFLPLVTAGIHILAAFQLISKLLTVFGLVNTSLFAYCTLATFLIFALVYWVVYMLTARVYYKIVSA